jgi:hypothetical protein
VPGFRSCFLIFRIFITFNGQICHLIIVRKTGIVALQGSTGKAGEALMEPGRYQASSPPKVLSIVGLPC